MTEARRQAWIGYAQSLGIALGLSFVMIPFLPNVPPGFKVLMGAIGSFVFGTGFFLLSYVRERVRMRSFGQNVLVQTLLTFATICICSCSLLWLGLGVALGPSKLFSHDLAQEFCKIVGSTYWLVSAFVGLFISGVINGYFQINRKLGPGVLWHWVTGKYYTPREEERIFMFLDMKDSTTLAERLGAIKFSALVRDFFRDMTYPALESKAQISHYIGDEAVIFWKPVQGFENANCLRLFFRMKTALALRRDYYIAEYGIVPEFKAGVHVGSVVATEVGELKSEIVFHGDTLNTAARIQGLCNELGELLISSQIAERLQAPKDLSLTELGPHALKGKSTEMVLFSVDRV